MTPLMIYTNDNRSYLRLQQVSVMMYINSWEVTVCTNPNI
jgi:hypothetical protein